MDNDNTELSLEPAGQQQMPAPAGRDDPNALMELAIRSGAGVETLERLMAVRRELRAEAAKTAFFDALAQFQARCPVIIKSRAVMNRDGKSVRYRFAPLDVIKTQVDPILRELGFSYQFDTEPETGWVKASCRLTHCAGHSETSSFKVPIDKDAYMNCQQQFASAQQFAKRYAFVNVLGILTGDQDDDASKAGEKTDKELSIELQKELWELMKPLVQPKPGEKATWNEARQWMIDEMCMQPEQSITKGTPDELREMISRVRSVLLRKMGDA